jgi:hypothetical protein
VPDQHGDGGRDRPESVAAYNMVLHLLLDTKFTVSSRYSKVMGHHESITRHACMVCACVAIAARHGVGAWQQSAGACRNPGCAIGCACDTRCPARWF